MKFLKVGASLLVTLTLIFSLNRTWTFGTTIPPLGKFLDPFHGFWQNSETGNPPSSIVSLDGLTAPVTIAYDSLLIPHIFAQNDEDLYFAQGYVTARARLWQMEFLTYAAAGRVSEVIGPVALDFDRSQRRLGMVYGAERTFELMKTNPTALLIVDSYTRGINSYIQSLRYEDFPIEYKLLGYSPEAWTSLKCALIQMTMCRSLNSGEKDLEMTNALKLFGPEVIDLLYPDNEHPGDPIVDNAGNWKFKPIQLDSTPLSSSSNADASADRSDQLVHLKPVDQPSPGTGSNNWAVSGAKTATGSPILCNDPHLDLRLPSIWYISQLHAPGVNVMGVNVPGAPTVAIGFNDSIAWGFTNAQRDLADWYRIQFKDSTKKEYLSDGQWKPSTRRIEQFKVKGDKNFIDTVVYTHHGPVVYDEHFHGENEKNHFAYRWISHDPSFEIIALHKLDRAKNHGDYMEALNNISSLAQNYAFASRSGDIAIRVQGKFPVRRKDEGKYILDGTKTSTEWKAFIPDEQDVMIKNPQRGFVSSANQYPADDTYPYYINGRSYEAYRNRRINKVLAGQTHITPQDLMALQSDTYNLQASESLPEFLNNLDSAKLTAKEAEVFHLLKSWNFYNSIESEAASYYIAWWNSVFAMTWDEMSKASVSLQTPTTYTTIHLIKTQPELSFFDIQDTPEKETARDVIRLSFGQAIKDVEKWKSENPGKNGVHWGDYKDTFIGHMLRGLPAFSYHVQHGGDHSTVDATSRTHGPSWRMVVSLEREEMKVWAVIPGGQSGNPGSPFYNSMLDRWTKGEYFRLHFPSEAPQLEKSALMTLTLKPVSR